MPELAYVNGEFCGLAEARVSVEDRGFQFADGVYEVIVAYGNRPFRLEEHLARLARSLDSIGLEFDIQEQALEEMIATGIARAGYGETMVYLQVTRGTAARAHVCPHSTRPTVVATFKPKPRLDPALRERGLSVVTVEDIRWARCDVKSIALLPAVLARHEAQRGGYDDAIFVGPGGLVREATVANLFAVCDGVLVTPPKSEAILHGVTRAYVLECAARIEVPHKEAELTVTELAAAREVLLSSTTMDIIGVTRLNDAPVGEQRVGPVTRALYEQFCRGIAAPSG